MNMQDASVSFQDLIIEPIRDWTGGQVIWSLGVGLLLFIASLSSIDLYYLSLF